MQCHRKSFSALVQFVTGHNFLRSHQAIVDFGIGYFPELPQAQCRFCQQEEESTYHILVNCNSFAFIRFTVFKCLTLTTPFTLKAGEILRFLKKSRLDPFRAPLLPREGGRTGC